MKEKKFTPGPWRCAPYLSENQRGFAVFATKPELTHIVDNMPEAEANLIAAAPDLLEALEMIMDENPASFMTFHEAMAKAATAIKKAYGETE